MLPRRTLAGGIPAPLQKHARPSTALLEAITKTVNGEERPAKEKHVFGIVVSTWRLRTCQPFWEAVGHNKDMGNNAVATFKAFIAIHRLIHDGYPTVCHEMWQLYRPHIDQYAALSGRSLSTFSKVCALFGQLLAARLDFHHRFPSFSGSLEDDVAVAQFALHDQKALMLDFMQLQQINFMLSSLIFSTARSLPADMAEAHRHEAFALMVQPMVLLAREIFFVYLRTYELIYTLAQKVSGEDMAVHKKRFDDLYRKMMQIFLDVKITGALTGLVELPDLPESPPEVALMAPASLARPKARAVPLGEEQGADWDDTGDPRDELIRRLRAENDDLRQQLEDSKGVIASLEHHIREICDIMCPGMASPDINEAVDAVKKTAERQANELSLLANSSPRRMSRPLSVSEDQLQAAHDDLLMAEATIASLRAMLDDQKHDKHRHHTESAETQRKISTLTAHLAETKEQADTATRELDLVQGLLIEARLQLRSESAERARLETACDTLRKEHADCVGSASAHAARMAAVEGELGAARGAAGKMAENAAEMAMQCKQLQASLDEANLRAMTSLKESLAVQEREAETKEQLHSLQQQLERATIEIAAAQAVAESGRKEAQGREEELKQKVRELQAELLESGGRLIAALESDVAAGQAVRAMQDDAAATRVRMAELETANGDLVAKVAVLVAREGELQSMRMQQQQAEATMARLREEQRAQAAQMAAMVLATAEEKQVHAAALQSLDADLARAQASVAALGEEKSQMVGKMVGLEAAVVEHVGLARVAAAERAQGLVQCEQKIEAMAVSAADETKSRQRGVVRAALAQARSTVVALSRLEPVIYGTPSASQLQEACARCRTHLQSLDASLLTLHKDNQMEAAAVSGAPLLADACIALGKGLVSMATEENNRPQETIAQCSSLGVALASAFDAAIRALDTDASPAAALSPLDAQLQSLAQRAAELSGLAVAKGDVLGSEMDQTSSIVDQATARIQALIDKAQAELAEGKLGVAPAILEASMLLMRLIKELLASASQTQHDIVQAESINKGQAPSQFYARHVRWVEGLVSAAKAVGAGAAVLVDCADGIVQGKGQHEQLMAASHDIAASTAQLVYASRARAPASSAASKALEGTSKKVADAVRSLINVARDQAVAAKEAVKAEDFLKLSVTQAKRLEMDAQIRVLTLEAALEHERERLGQLRKARYRDTQEE